MSQKHVHRSCHQKNSPGWIRHQLNDSYANYHALHVFACGAFSLSFSSSKEIKSSSSSNLFTTNSKSSSSFLSTDFSRRGFLFLSFFSCSVSHISLIFFYSASGSWMSCNNSTDFRHLFDLFDACFFDLTLCEIFSQEFLRLIHCETLNGERWWRWCWRWIRSTDSKKRLVLIRKEGW
jgi:hypothetical protein